MMEFSNYAQLPADRVKAACIKYLDKRDARIEREREEIIEQYMRPCWFGLVKRTREQAIKYAQNDEPFGGSWYTPAMRGASVANDINALGLLAKAAIEQQVNDKVPMVLVNADMASILIGFMEE